MQAHPFREDFYIDHIRLYPNAEGVEVFNANRTPLCNRLGKFYAQEYGKIEIGGSDLHRADQRVLSGMAFEERLTSEQELIRFLRQGKGEILETENKYVRKIRK